MYKKRRDRYGKLRINRFKGLNQSDNARNIDDAELSIMKNLYLEKDGTIKSRKGWQSVTAGLTFTRSILGVCKTVWEDVGSALYVMGNYFLYHINEQTWAETSMGVIGSPPEHVSFQRYKDKLLFLFPGQELKYIKSDNSISSVDYPQPQPPTGAGIYIAASAGGELDPTTTYQYCVSFTLGSDFRDGETIGSLPADEYTNFTDPKNPPPVILEFPAGHPYGTTTADNRILTATNQPFSCNLNGYDISLVNLFRRGAIETGAKQFVAADGSFWEHIDSAYVQKVLEGSDYIYQFDGNWMSGEDANGTAVGVITDITGTYDSTTDNATLYVDFTDNGTVDSTAGYIPRSLDTDAKPSAKYVTRLYNRVLLANIQGVGRGADKKKVYFSYRGYTGLGTGENEMWEIDDFPFEHPMLIFPPNNFFYCDLEDPEDEITGLATFQDNVLIFTAKCTFLWREGMFDPMRVANDVGCLSNSSICEFEGKLVWLAKNGVYQYDGKNVKNLTYEKVNKYIEGIGAATAHKASGAIHDRKYFLAAPFESDTANNYVLVYDFDLKEWYIYEYMFNLNTDRRIYIDYLFNYSEGAEETLYAGVHAETTDTTFMVKLESGYSDYWYHAANSSDGIPIEYDLRTKYFDFEAPDIEKAVRNVFVRLCGYKGDATLDTYIDQTDAADNSVTVSGSGSGFLVNSSIVNEDYIENASNAAYAISLPQGLTGAAFQFGLSGEQWGVQLEIKSLGADWLPKRKVARTIGG